MHACTCVCACVPHVLAQPVLCWRLRACRVQSLVAGLALCNQHTSVLTVAPLAAVVVFDVANRQSVGKVVIVGLCGLVGLAPYVYLPLSARGVLQSGGDSDKFFARSVGSWGDVGTWDGFWAHLLRRECVGRACVRVCVCVCLAVAECADGRRCLGRSHRANECIPLRDNVCRFDTHMTQVWLFGTVASNISQLDDVFSFTGTFVRSLVHSTRQHTSVSPQATAIHRL